MKINSELNLSQRIKQMCKEKNAIILAHYYTTPDIQDVADFVGDSLALARQAASTDAEIIVMCGVYFMAETCKILCPKKKVLIPDVNAGCSLADSCNVNALSELKNKYPNYTVVTYVNTSAAIKALSDVVVTSGNAERIVSKLPKEEKIIFAPDYNLGDYINKKTGRNMLLWQGGCHVHQRFSIKELIHLKEKYPQAEVLAHPECKRNLLILADVIGSTAVLLKYTQESKKNIFIVATETGIFHEMKNKSPQKTFIPVPPELSEENKECSCNECSFMKMNTLLKTYNALLNEKPEVNIDDNILFQARKPIEKMLSMS